VLISAEIARREPNGYTATLATGVDRRPHLAGNVQEDFRQGAIREPPEPAV
jgi:hypothetical protein